MKLEKLSRKPEKYVNLGVIMVTKNQAQTVASFLTAKIIFMLKTELVKLIYLFLCSWFGKSLINCLM